MAKLTYADIIANDRRFTAIADRACQLDAIDAAALMTRLVDLVEPNHLILLADAFHIMGDEGWNYADTDEQKRNLIKMAIPLHRHKGTPWAVKQLLANYGLLDKIQMIEWWQPNPLPRPQPPKSVDLITDAATTPEVVRVLPSLEQTKPAGTVLRPVTLQTATVEDVPVMLMLGMATIRTDATTVENAQLSNGAMMAVFAQVTADNPWQQMSIPAAYQIGVFTSNYTLLCGGPHEIPVEFYGNPGSPHEISTGISWGARSRQAVFPMLSRRANP